MTSRYTAITAPIWSFPLVRASINSPSGSERSYEVGKPSECTQCTNWHRVSWCRLHNIQYMKNAIISLVIFAAVAASFNFNAAAVNKAVAAASTEASVKPAKAAKIAKAKKPNPYAGRTASKAASTLPDTLWLDPDKITSSIEPMTAKDDSASRMLFIYNDPAKHISITLRATHKLSEELSVHMEGEDKGTGTCPFETGKWTLGAKRVKGNLYRAFYKINRKAAKKATKAPKASKTVKSSAKVAKAVSK